MNYVSLHTHSVFSFHAGVATVQQLVSQAQTLGMKALALTDRDRMSGLILFYQACKRAGIKPILGVELTEPGKPNEHIVILAKNEQGYRDLCSLITQRHVDDSFSFAKIFSAPWNNFVLFTNFPHLFELLAQSPNRKHLLGELINNAPLTRSRSRAIEALAVRYHVPLIASNNAYFLEQKEWETHKILAAIGLNSTLTRLKPEEYASQRAYLRSSVEMERLFPHHLHALTMTETVARACTVDLSLGTWILPKIDVPPHYTPETWLRKLAWEGCKREYAHRPTYEQAKKIQRRELTVIEKLGYASYFLFVKDIRDWANEHFRGGYRRPKDCSILRGSAANSITFFNLGVSDLDPIKYDLYFERFLNEDRASPPDADLDFGWDEREEVLDFIIKQWGQERVAITCTTNHFRRKAAFRETAKVFGYSEEQITKILKSHKTVTRQIVDDEIRMILHKAQQIQGKPRFLGQHPGGVLITNEPITTRVACEYSGGPKNRIITQIDMHNGIDELGLIKFDILGNGSLSVLRDTLGQLSQQGLTDPQVYDLDKCYQDARVQEIIKNGRTKGIFYIESPAQTRLNKKAQARTFEEITITSSLIRPAGATYTSRYVERERKAKRGIQDWDFLHPSLIPILKRTHDVCAFQEDITKICHQVAGLSYKKADKIRKLMNSLHEGILTPEEYHYTAEEFLRGCMINNGLTQKQALELWERVSSFTGFSFCKSHSASYAQLSFQCTYLKAHYPAQFLAAVISNRHGFYTPNVYLDEARRWGVRILPMGINESKETYYGKHHWIRPGFMHVRSLSAKSIAAITALRDQGGPYRNLADFIKRTPTKRSEIENLILVGAFDGFGMSQPELLFLLDGIYGKLRPETPDLFASDPVLKRHGPQPGLSNYTLTERCLNELKLLGFMLSGNILDILDLHPEAKDTVPAQEIHNHVGRTIKIFGWPITQRSHVITHNKRLMKFITLEDKTECVDVVLWPEVVDTYADVLTFGGPFAVWGKVTEEWDAYTVEAHRISAVQWSPAQMDFERASKQLKSSYTEQFTYRDIGNEIAA